MAFAANVRHRSRVHLIGPLPTLIHCSAVPRRGERHDALVRAGDGMRRTMAELHLDQG
jgi:hypothetical protein